MERKLNPENHKSFEGKELQEIKRKLEELSLDRGAVLETPGVVYEILHRVYPDQKILIKSIEYLGDTKFKLGFVFPQYELSKESINHVSGVQMTLARYQAMIVIIPLAIRLGIIASDISYDISLKNLYNVLHREYQGVHRKILYPGDTGYLVISADDVIKKMNYYIFTAKFHKDDEVFLYGQEKCILENRFLEKEE